MAITPPRIGQVVPDLGSDCSATPMPAVDARKSQGFSVCSHHPVCDSVTFSNDGGTQLPNSPLECCGSVSGIRNAFALYLEHRELASRKLATTSSQDRPARVWCRTLHAKLGGKRLAAFELAGRILLSTGWHSTLRRDDAWI
ncbi:MAG TPA: hypothetical protein VFV61_01920 [Pyrinomonadaceae bacterium]|nr:hypothetical protein [Pyrinomonadaceae bacterium]